MVVFKNNSFLITAIIDVIKLTYRKFKFSIHDYLL